MAETGLGHGEQDSLALERALAERSRHGDREAFEELVHSTGRVLFLRMYLEIGDAHVAEDLAQETFLLAWKSIRSLSIAQSFRPWLFSIGHRVLLEDIRRRSRKKRSAANPDMQKFTEPADHAPTPPEASETQEQRQRVLAALRSLPEEYRMPLTLRYLSGADYETIGKELAISNGSLRGMLSRGMALLREKLKGQ